MRKFALVALLSLFSSMAICQGDAPIKDVRDVLNQQSVKQYARIMKEYTESFIQDDWDLRSPANKIAWATARKNQQLAEFKKTLKNKQGVSLFEKEMQLVKAQVEVEALLIRKGRITREQFKEAVQLYLKENRTAVSPIIH